MDALGDIAVRHLGLAELKALVAVDRRIALLHHLHEDLGMLEELSDRRRGVGISGGRIVPGKGLLLCANHVLRGGDIGGAGGGHDGKQEGSKQDNGAHQKMLPMCLPGGSLANYTAAAAPANSAARLPFNT